MDYPIPSDLQERYDAIRRMCTHVPPYANAEELREMQLILRVARLRGLLISAARETGAMCTDQVSDEFLGHVPQEVKLRIKALKESRNG